MDTWANQACGQMQNIVGYLKSACQYTTPNENPGQEVTALLKLRAMASVKDYLCQNDEVNLKEMAMNNAAQCVRRTNLADFGCNNLNGSPNPVTLNSGPIPRYATAIILNVPSYSNDNCR